MIFKCNVSEVGDSNLFAQDIVQWWAAVGEFRATWNAEKFLKN